MSIMLPTSPLFWLIAPKTHRSSSGMAHTNPTANFEAGQGRASGKSLHEARVPASLPDHDTIRNDLLDYDMEVEFADHHFGQMLRALEKAGELERTIVIVTSDHGMPFPRAKATGLYDDATHIPLMMRGPGISGGGREVTDFVGLMDLAPTILDLAGVEVAQKWLAKA